MTKVNTSTSLCDISTLDFSSMVRKVDGEYSTVMPLSADNFIRCAKILIAKRYQRLGIITCPQDSKDYFITALATAENEKFCVLYLDAQNQIIAFEILFSGTIDRAVIHPRIVVKQVLAHNAAAIIIAHNHVSGKINLSLADIETTKTLKQALKPIDVEVLDHIIVAGEKAESMAETKML